MTYILLFIACYFTNLMEVYHIQGTLTNMRLPKWWEETLSKKYECKNIKIEKPEVWKYDSTSWIPCLVAHAFEWAFIMMIPLAVYGYCTYKFDFEVTFWYFYVIAFAANATVHYIVDLFKNVNKTTWLADQAIHLGQIVVTIAAFAFTV